jgi:hypothetical protein
MKNTTLTIEAKGISRGDYSVKQHLSNGPKTMCNKNSLHKNEKDQFILAVKNFPEVCCQKCITYLTQRGLIK